MTGEFYPLYRKGELDPQSISILKKLKNMELKPFSETPIEEVRANFFEKAWLGRNKDNVNIADFMIKSGEKDLPLRIYTPEGETPFPILIYYHGGGFVVGSVNEFDSICTMIADGVKCIVVSVDYNLAPEYKHPSQIEDADAAMRWIYRNAASFNGDGNRIGIAGDSAGGNLTAVSTFIARDKEIFTPKCQVLICPWVDVSSYNRESYNYFGNGMWLSLSSMIWFRDQYLKNEEQRFSTLASPILADNFKELPPAFVMTAEFDVLCDEGKEYADKLIGAGIPVEFKCYKGMMHDFVTLPGLFKKANDAIDDICDYLKRML